MKKYYTLFDKNYHSSKTYKIHPHDVYDNIVDLFLKDCEVRRAIRESSLFFLVEGFYDSHSFIFEEHRKLSIDEWLNKCQKLIILK